MKPMIPKWFPMLLVLMLVWAFPSIAMAAALVDDVMPSQVARLLDLVVQILLPVAAVIGTIFAGLAAKWIQRKTGLNVQDQLNDLVSRAVGFAEEKAHQALVNHGKRLSGPEKLEAAMDFALDLAEKYKLPQWARDRLAKLIDSELGKWRPMKKVDDSVTSGDVAAPSV